MGVALMPTPAELHGEVELLIGSGEKRARAFNRVAAFHKITREQVIAGYWRHRRGLA